MSESHKNSQNLTIEQLNAIDLLVQGLINAVVQPLSPRDREVAENVGVARETVTRWRNENPYLDEIISEKAVEFADQIKQAASFGGLCY